MEIRIFDVAHGFCAYIIADNGNVILVDCGHNAESGFRPSTYLSSNGCTGIEKFIVSNYDEDHVSDLPNLRNLLPIQVLHRNKSMDVNQLRRLKLRGGPIAPGMEAMLSMIGTYTSTVTDPPEFPGIELAFFSNPYPTFEDTNNLSLVTFLHYSDIHIVLPGDLELPGWRSLMKKSAFLQHLGRINFFVASHHGRENGYCPEVFDYCHPELVIYSDGPIRYGTQDTTDLYRQHVKGIRWDQGVRYVLTTRRDGMITIKQLPGAGPTVRTTR